MQNSATHHFTKNLIAAAAMTLFCTTGYAASYVVRIGAPAKCPVSGCVVTPPGAGGSGSGGGGGTVTPPDNGGPSAGTPAVTLTPGSLDFGSGIVAIGSQGLLSVEVKNSGTAPLTITGIDVLDKRVFNQNNNCGTGPLAPNATCTITANFVPTGIAAESDVLAVTTNAGTPGIVTLTGTAMAPAIGITGSTSFGTISETATGTATFSFTPANASEVRASYVTLTGSNLTVQSSNCGTQAAPITLAAGQSCALTVRWAPTAAGALSGSSLGFRSQTLSQTYSLSGTATAAPSNASLSTSSLAFGAVDYPTSSVQSFSVTNTGGGSMSVSLAKSGSSMFTYTDTCSAPLARGESCSVDVTMTATGSSVTTETGSISVTAGGQTQNVALSGTARRARVDATKSDGSSAASLDFGLVTVGATADRVYTITNNGQLSATGLYVELEAATSGFSLQSNTCGTLSSPVSLAAGANCSVTLQWVPTAAGATSGTNRIMVRGEAQNLPATLNFSGTAQLTGIASFNSGAYRAWSDGTYAASCNLYKSPTGNYSYTGSTGSGTYRIQSGAGTLDVYCDMDSNGGGWTKVVQLYDRSAVNNPPWTGGSVTVSGKTSFTLTSSQIPAHTQTAFGKDDVATTVDYFNTTYSTGNIARTQVTGLKTGLNYYVYRNSANYYDHHAPEKTISSTDPLWMNTLSIDVIDNAYSHNWGFALKQNAGKAGYSMQGQLLEGSTETYAWTVWVR